MSIPLLLAELRRRAIELRVEDGRLRCRAPPGALDAALREQLRQHRDEIVDFLGAVEALAARSPAIVPLQPAGGLPPVFAVPGHNGDVFCFRELARLLGRDQPFFGLQPPGLDGRSQPLPSVEALAAHFAAPILALRPAAPAIIAGYCAGGCIAFELARRLLAAGLPIRMVALFGSPRPAWYRFLPQLQRRLDEQRARFGRHLRSLLGASRTAWRPYFAAKLRERRQRLARERQHAADDPLQAARARLGKATLRAVRRYRPGHFAGRVCQFLPNAGWQRASAFPLAWPASLAAPLETYCGSDGCSGDSMLLAADAPQFAALFRHCRDRP